MRVTLLGTGPSGGVPLLTGRPGGFWRNCDPAEPRNRRGRTSALVEIADRSILIDAGPDLRTQLLATGLKRLDAVLFTHAHADHVAGIDDLRQANRIMGAAIPAFADAATLAELRHRFAYAFRPHTGGFFGRPALLANEIEAGTAFQAAGVEILPIRQDHGFGPSLGFRIGRFAYCTDVLMLDDTALAALHGLDLWVVGCFHRQAHPAHANLDQVCAWAEALRPARTVLTHMGDDLDYATTAAALPAGMEPGFDGWTATLPDSDQKVP